jgi:hypothetical protein
MKTYAVFFKTFSQDGAVLDRVEDVSARYETLTQDGGDGEAAANTIQQETGASAVVCAQDRAQAILEAADVCGIEEYIEG